MTLSRLTGGKAMNHRIVFSFVCLGAAMVLLTCSSGQQHGQRAACVVGMDTLSLAEIQGMAPDSASVKDKISRAALQMTLSRESGHPCGGAVRDSGLYSDLSNQLSLQTGTGWSPQSAACLYSAAKAVRRKFKELPTARAVAVYVDSLFSSTVHLDSGVLRHMAVNDSLLATLDNEKTRQDLEKLLRSIFHISAKTAIVLADFLISEDAESTQATDVSSYIKGLVADTHPQTRQAPSSPASKAPPVVQDPKLALKYRPQQLISDSIKKHIPDLEAIYKKQLKMHPNLSGTVWVTFVILPNGSIASTQIHSADIGEKDFLNPFSQYVQRIRFSKIPDPVGPMTFEFPFEFSPEN
jgi:hypothetical protein